MESISRLGCQGNRFNTTPKPQQAQRTPGQAANFLEALQSPSLTKPGQNTPLPVAASAAFSGGGGFTTLFSNTPNTPQTAGTGKRSVAPSSGLNLLA